MPAPNNNEMEPVPVALSQRKVLVNVQRKTMRPVQL